MYMYDDDEGFTKLMFALTITDSMTTLAIIVFRAT